MQEHSSTRRRLSDILAGNLDQIHRQWDETEAAADLVPLPAGTYEAHVQTVELFNAKTGTPGVKMTFRVAEGEHAGRYLFHNLWLTSPALPQTKRDCLKLGIKSLEELETAELPPGRIRCKLRVALRREDDGTEYNRVRHFDVLRIDEPERDAFAPTDDAGGDAEPSGDTSFDPERLEADSANAAEQESADAPGNGQALLNPEAAAGDGPADSAAWARR